MKSFRVFGHGDDDSINTLASFQRVRETGADGVELDVRRTKNDELVVVHDPVGDELPPHVPSFEEALDACRGLVVNVEIKNFPRDPEYDSEERVTDLVLDLLERRDDDVLISCFGTGCLERVRERRPDLPTAFLLLSRRVPGELLDRAVPIGCAAVHPYDTMVDTAFMTAARERDLTVNVWTGEDESVERFTELIGLGVDGIITSAPQRAMEAAGRR